MKVVQKRIEALNLQTNDIDNSKQQQQQQKKIGVWAVVVSALIEADANNRMMEGRSYTGVRACTEGSIGVRWVWVD